MWNVVLDHFGSFWHFRPDSFPCTIQLKLQQVRQGQRHGWGRCDLLAPTGGEKRRQREARMDRRNEGVTTSLVALQDMSMGFPMFCSVCEHYVPGNTMVY